MTVIVRDRHRRIGFPGPLVESLCDGELLAQGPEVREIDHGEGVVRIDLQHALVKPHRFVEASGHAFDRGEQEREHRVLGVLGLELPEGLLVLQVVPAAHRPEHGACPGIHRGPRDPIQQTAGRPRGEQQRQHEEGDEPLAPAQVRKEEDRPEHDQPHQRGQRQDRKRQQPPSEQSGGIVGQGTRKPFLQIVKERGSAAQAHQEQTRDGAQAEPQVDDQHGVSHLVVEDARVSQSDLQGGPALAGGPAKITITAQKRDRQTGVRRPLGRIEARGEAEIILRSTVVPFIEPAPGLGEEGAGDLRSAPQPLSLHEVEGDLDLAGRFVFVAAPLQGLLFEPQIGEDLPRVHSLLERQDRGRSLGLSAGSRGRSRRSDCSRILNQRAVGVENDDFGLLGSGGGGGQDREKDHGPDRPAPGAASRHGGGALGHECGTGGRLTTSSTSSASGG